MTVAMKKKEVLMSNKLGEKMENKLAAQEADSEIDNLEEEVAINEKIAKTERQVSSSTKDVAKTKLLEETAKVDKNLCKFKRHSTTKTNELFYADAEKAEERKDQMWRRRLQNSINGLRKDLSESKNKEVSNVRHWQTLENTLLEELDKVLKN